MIKKIKEEADKRTNEKELQKTMIQNKLLKEIEDRK